MGGVSVGACQLSHVRVSAGGVSVRVSVGGVSVEPCQLGVCQ